jgi:hypothetical protein
MKEFHHKKRIIQWYALRLQTIYKFNLQVGKEFELEQLVKMKQLLKLIISDGQNFHRG